MTYVPVATTSGLNRPKLPSTSTPTFPRPENEATWFELSVMFSHGVFVLQVMPSLFVEVPSGRQIQVLFVMLRACSSPPTVITFLAVAGERTVPALPDPPASS